MNRIIIFLGLFLMVSNGSLFAKENPIKVDPLNFWSIPEKTHKLKVSGGLPPYRWQTGIGYVKKSLEEEGVFIYTTPKRYGKDWINFEDRAAQQVTVKIDILRPLRVSPSKMNLNIKDKANIRIYGGSGDWEILNHDDFEILEKSDDIFIVKPISKPGEKQITIKDNITKKTINVNINVYGSLNIEEVKK